ncbi:sodium channel protein Nach [Eupeodes corollae]|uniref:sodium channel protein Nach n=1 Tax=Eupeodes corollae TaxID=290404 RepID=UPI002493A662|nr:sodium channel protein Nach [Eupeodes corollae]
MYFDNERLDLYAKVFKEFYELCNNEKQDAYYLCGLIRQNSVQRRRSASGNELSFGSPRSDTCQTCQIHQQTNAASESEEEHSKLPKTFINRRLKRFMKIYVKKALCAWFIWMVIVVAMFSCAIAMVIVFYRDFSSNPIRMNIESDHTPLTNLIFPAVTLCPPTMYNLPAVKEIFQNLTMPKNVSQDEAINALNQLYALVGIVRVFDQKKLDILQRTASGNNLTTLEFLQLIRWNCSDLMYRCRFQSKIMPCSELFYPGKTFTGYCCSFNFKDYGVKYQRRRALKFGPEGGLSVIMKDTKRNQKDLDQFLSSEVELFVHQNEDFPHRTLISNSIPVNRETFAVIRPTEIVCSESFKALAVQDRQCLLNHEHNMRYFSIYNSDNCEFECRVLKTFDSCGCVPFLYYSKKSRAKVCDFTSLPCLYKSYNYFGIYIEDEDSQIDRNKTIETTSVCYCPNSCENVEYDVKITQARLQTVIESFDSFYHGIQDNFTVVHVFMNSQVYRRLRRDTLSDIIILISNLGSSFSLFVGMSMISLLEILYFFTLVLLQNYMRQDRFNQRNENVNKI